MQGFITLLPSRSLYDISTSFNDVWRADAVTLACKGAGFFLGIALSAIGLLTVPRDIGGGGGGSSHEVSVAVAMLMTSGALAVRPFCYRSLYICASHLAEGCGRALATIGKGHGACVARC